MKRLLKGGALVMIGAIAGSVMTASSAAQQPRDAGVRLNAVGLSVRDMEAERAFYTKTFGFREAFTLRDKDGKPTMTFLQVSPVTFLQLVPANPNRPPGLSSVLLEVDDVQAAVAKLRQAGGQLQDPRVSPNTKSTLTSITDPEGIRVELIQMTPGSLIRTAMDSWK